MDTAFLLLAVAARIHSGQPDIGSVEVELEQRPHAVVDTFGRIHQGLAKQARYTVLMRAADHVLGGTAVTWMRDAAIDGERLYDLALGSDAGLRRVLEVLEGLDRRR